MSTFIDFIVSLIIYEINNEKLIFYNNDFGKVFF